MIVSTASRMLNLPESVWTSNGSGKPLMLARYHVPANDAVVLGLALSLSQAATGLVWRSRDVLS